MDYILLLQYTPGCSYNQDDFIGHDCDIGKILDVLKENGLRYMKVETSVERRPEEIPRWDHVKVLDYEDYVVEVPHEKAEEVGLALRRGQGTFNVIITREREATADWPSVISRHDRLLRLPIVRKRRLAE